jgi:hypothetical protein
MVANIFDELLLLHDNRVLIIEFPTEGKADNYAATD